MRTALWVKLPQSRVTQRGRKLTDGARDGGLGVAVTPPAVVIRSIELPNQVGVPQCAVGTGGDVGRGRPNGPPLPTTADCFLRARLQRGGAG